MAILCALLGAYSLVILVSIVLSYVVVMGRQPADHPVSRVWRATSRIVDPVLSRVRMVIKPVRLGSASLDLSPIVVLFGISLVRGSIC